MDHLYSSQQDNSSQPSTEPSSHHSSGSTAGASAIELSPNLQSAISWTTSQRGGQQLVLDGEWLYRANGSTSQKTYWKCIKSSCNAKTYIDRLTGQLAKVDQHNHEAVKVAEYLDLDNDHPIKTLVNGSRTLPMMNEEWIVQKFNELIEQVP